MTLHDAVFFWHRPEEPIARSALALHCHYLTHFPEEPLTERSLPYHAPLHRVEESDEKADGLSNPLRVHEALLSA